MQFAVSEGLGSEPLAERLPDAGGPAASIPEAKSSPASRLLCSAATSGVLGSATVGFISDISLRTTGTCCDIDVVTIFSEIKIPGKLAAVTVLHVSRGGHNRCWV